MGQINICYPVNGNFPTSVGGTGLSVKYFPNIPGPSIGAANATPSSSSAVGQLPVPGGNVLNGQRFDIDVVGNVSIDPTISCPAITVALYANTGTVSSPSYTAIASTGAVTAGNFDNEDFRISASLSGTTASGNVSGTYSALFNGALVNSTPKAAAVLTGISFASALPFGLVVGVTFSVSGANNKANLYQFSLSS